MKITRGKAQAAILMTGAEYRDLDDNFCGICLACGELSDGGCEPDARGYACDACGKPKVFGVSELIMLGYIQIEEEDNENCTTGIN